VIANPKVLLQCLEGAIVAAVSEPVLLEHIEWYGSAQYASFRRERQTALWHRYKRRMSQADAHRSTPGLGLVTHALPPLVISRINGRGRRCPARHTSRIRLLEQLTDPFL